MKGLGIAVLVITGILTGFMVASQTKALEDNTLQDNGTLSHEAESSQNITEPNNQTDSIKSSSNSSVTIVSFAPSSPVNDTIGTSRTFNITVNQIVNVTWRINGTQVQHNERVTQASYTNTNAAKGTWNVSAIAENRNGTAMQTWIWIVKPPVPGIIGYAPQDFLVYDGAGATRTFNITVNQTVNVTWEISGNKVQTNESVTNASYTNTSAAQGTWIVSANATNENGTAIKSWIWIVLPEPRIIDFSPSSSQVRDVQGATRTFSITLSQAANVTWKINGTQVKRNENVTQASYTNTSAAKGTWNVSAIAENKNGTAMQTWEWIVSEETPAPTPTQTSGTPTPTPTQTPGSGNGGGSGGGSSSGGGGGGGGGGMTSDENYANIEAKEKYDLDIFKDKVASYTLKSKNSPIFSISITGTVNAGEISILVEVLKNTSSLVKNPAPGMVYKNINIWAKLPPKYIRNSIIKFKVDNSWLAEKNINPSQISMLRWDGKWNELPTEQAGKDVNFTYYEAKTNAFSPFAVVAKPESKIETTPLPTITTTPTPTPTIIASSIEVPLNPQNPPSHTDAQMLIAVLWLNTFIKPPLAVLAMWIAIIIINIIYYRAEVKKGNR